MSVSVSVCLWNAYPTEKPGAVLTRVPVPGAAREFSPRFNFQCRLSYGVHAAPCVQLRASTSVGTLKSHVVAAIPLSGHTKLLHTLERMGSAVLADVVPLITMVSRLDFPARDEEVLKNSNNNNNNKKKNVTFTGTIQNRCTISR